MILNKADEKSIPVFGVNSCKIKETISDLTSCSILIYVTVADIL
jgi:hypothetical protein